MDTIFTLGDSNENTNMNLDELYEKKQKHDLNTLETYNKILNRIHSKIKVISRQNFTTTILLVCYTRNDNWCTKIRPRGLYCIYY